ncbi:hypothetical protein [Spongiactinospora sp. TRM90649]|uniref:hypothetical protein n=1 Tax=Spongiactinospora sp. TRM90649 TaxID=3031114 RepID=UPI0023F9151A|nr:hypothetical protein [Spongiactinospora sp. TRM90649]MDF5755222.1 hypothetical protein [Spongiactinospora sp. TRM90649]
MSRNITMCRLELDPAADTERFEHAVLEEVFPVAGDRPRHADWLFARSLYRTWPRTGAPAYLCAVDSIISTGVEFHGMRGPLTALGARFARPPRSWPPYVSVPDDKTASEEERGGHHTGLLTVLLRLPYERDQEEFERALTEAMTAAVETGATRVNTIKSARWLRDDDSSLGAVEYLCKATGFIMDGFSPGTREPLEKAGGEIVGSETHERIGWLDGGTFPP